MRVNTPQRIDFNDFGNEKPRIGALITKSLFYNGLGVDRPKTALIYGSQCTTSFPPRSCGLEGGRLENEIYRSIAKYRAP